MLVSRFILSFLVFLFSLPVNSAIIVRDSPVNFPLKKRFPEELPFGAFKHLSFRDAARAKHLRGRGQTLLPMLKGLIGSAANLIRDEGHTEEATNNAVFYTASIGIGNPPTNCMFHQDYVDN
ncbi:hypothetical protein C0992_011042 [Termitomyces sp. T32_za158]|nr:hypothetical protein C0992_011042 [Termitomyces sp. T32_za158]